MYKPLLLLTVLVTSCTFLEGEPPKDDSSMPTLLRSWILRDSLAYHNSFGENAPQEVIQDLKRAWILKNADSLVNAAHRLLLHEQDSSSTTRPAISFWISGDKRLLEAWNYPSSKEMEIDKEFLQWLRKPGSGSVPFCPLCTPLTEVGRRGANGIDELKQRIGQAWASGMVDSLVVAIADYERQLEEEPVGGRGEWSEEQEIFVTKLLSLQDSVTSLKIMESTLSTEFLVWETRRSFKPFWHHKGK